MKTPLKQKLITLLIAAGLLSCQACLTASAQTQTNKLRIGVYDSRVIAVAYGNSPEFQETLKPVMAEYKKAKEAKDDKRMKQLEAQMKLKQRRLHEQGFSTGSVISIMATVKDSLPAVAKDTGVDVIVSKWEVNYQSPSVEIVDVTGKVAALFHTSERGKKWLKQIPEKPPVPIDQITDDMD